jgi:hypothetical protein
MRITAVVAMVECPGGEPGCTARLRWCLCGVLACCDHGHTAYGDDFYCAYLNLGPVDAPPPPRLTDDIDLSAWVARQGGSPCGSALGGDTPR